MQRFHYITCLIEETNMKIFYLLAALFLFAFSCKKTGERPQSKTDFLPINFAVTPASITQGEPIVSHVNCGFYDSFADIYFLGFELKEGLAKQYDIKAKAFYDNIQHRISLPVVSTFDTTLTLQTPEAGLYILRFYSFETVV